MALILAKGFFGRSNLGDDAILARWVQWLVKTPHRLVVASGRNRKEVQEICATYGSESLEQIPDTFGSLLLALIRMQVFVLGGGGLFPSDAPKALISRLMLILAARLMSCRVVLIGIGMNPVSNRLSKLIWRCIVSMSDLVTVRDQFSYDSLVLAVGHCGASEKIHRCADLVMSLDIPPAGDHQSPKSALLNDRKNICAVALAQPWNREEIIQRPGRYDRFLSDMHFLLEEILSNGYAAVLVPFLLPEDLGLARKVAAAFPVGEVVVEDDESMACRIEWFRRASVTMAMRFHALVLAARMGCPTFVIAYDHKSENLAADLGLSDYTVRFGIRTSEFFKVETDIPLALAKTRLERVLSSAATLRSAMANSIQEQDRLSKQNFRLLDQVLARRARS